MRPPAREVTPWGQFELRRSHLVTERPGARFRAVERDVDPLTARAAALTVCGLAADAADARPVLEALGLLT